MIRFFGIMGLLGVVTFLVLLIISIFRKTPKQKWVIGILASLLCMSFGIMISLNDSINVIEKELKEVTEAKESLERELEGRELLEEANSTVPDIFSNLFDDNAFWLDEVMVYVIPVEGDSPDDIMVNAIDKVGEITEHMSTFARIHSLTSKEHFYFRIVDKNMKTILEQYISADGDNVNGTVGIDYLDYMR